MPERSDAAATGCVIDASVTMPWFFEDEATPFTETLLDALGARPLWAPPLWVLECTNVLQSAARRRRIDAPRRSTIASELARLPVRLDTDPPTFVELDRVAAGSGLSAYDAAYLELAVRRNARARDPRPASPRRLREARTSDTRFADPLTGLRPSPPPRRNTPMTLTIEHHPESSRFQAVVDGLNCVADYRLADGVIAVTHTGVPPALEGRGIAGQLMAALFEHAKVNGLKVAPWCSYAAAYMRRHPETASLRA